MIEETLQTKKDRVLQVVNRLKEVYPDAQCSLNYRKDKPYELLIATRLSAQCTDARVNLVVGPLFEKYRSIEQIADAQVDDIAQIIRSCGLYKTKAKDIVEMAKMIRDDFCGELPDNMDDLTKLPGIGRKTANLIMGDVYHKPAVVVDTHCIRINGRLGFCEGKDPVRIEKVLKELLPPEESSDYCHRIVQFGRDTCTARAPKCSGCPLSALCPSHEQ